MKIIPSYFAGLLLILTILFAFYCSRQDSNETYTIELKNGIENVVNIKPLYDEKEFISLEKIYSIELISDKYEVSMTSHLIADNENNLYVLGYFECAIIVFDDKGNYLRTMGQKGQGPQDLLEPILLSLYDNRLYILEGFYNIKIWNTQGEYVQKIFITPGNYEMMKRLKDNYLLFSKSSRKGSQIMKYSLIKASEDFKDTKVLFTYDKNNDSEFLHDLRYPIAVDSKNQIYFLEKSDIYSIIKFDLTGKPILKFGRDYKRIPLSDETVENYQKLYGDLLKSGQIPALPKYPPVIRRIFLDSQENVWVVSGEIFQDKFELVTDGTIDIFNDEGIWLCTFKMNDISVQSIIKNDRLYNITNIDSKTGQQYINVYKIHYNY